MSPGTSTTVGEPRPRHSRYILRFGPMATIPARAPGPGTKAGGTAVVAVVVVASAIDEPAVMMRAATVRSAVRRRKAICTRTSRIPVEHPHDASVLVVDRCDVGRLGHRHIPNDSREVVVDDGAHCSYGRSPSVRRAWFHQPCLGLSAPDLPIGRRGSSVGHPAHQCYSPPHQRLQYAGA
jgi:hypothetical protein